MTVWRYKLDDLLAMIESRRQRELRDAEEHYHSICAAIEFEADGLTGLAKRKAVDGMVDWSMADEEAIALEKLQSFLQLGRRPTT